MLELILSVILCKNLKKKPNKQTNKQNEEKYWGVEPLRLLSINYYTRGVIYFLNVRVLEVRKFDGIIFSWSNTKTTALIGKFVVDIVMFHDYNLL